MPSPDTSSDLFWKMVEENDDETRAVIRAAYVAEIRRQSREAVDEILRRGKTRPSSREDRP